jgi:hypothetical protein
VVVEINFGQVPIEQAMKTRSKIIFLFSYLASLCWCSSSPTTNEWQKADEGSFTFDSPKWLVKQVVHPIDSHCGKYSSSQMQFDFDEVHGLGYTKEKAQAKQSEFEKAFGQQKGEPTGSQFYLKLGKRYASVSVGADEKWVKWHYPGKYCVEFFSPDTRGGYLSIWITYKDEKDTDTALRIVKSVQTK